MKNDGETNLLIDYYVGAYGPTIRIDIRSFEGLIKLKSLFMRLAEAEVRKVDVSQLNSVVITGIKSLVLELIPENQFYEKSLELIGDDREGAVFRWSKCRSGWIHCAGLIDGLIDANSPAHQYLTNEGIDDALVEVSFLEA
jgi:hypothetical protein